MSNTWLLSAFAVTAAALMYMQPSVNIPIQPPILLESFPDRSTRVPHAVLQNGTAQFVFSALHGSPIKINLAYNPKMEEQNTVHPVSFLATQQDSALYKKTLEGYSSSFLFPEKDADVMQRYLLETPSNFWYPAIRNLDHQQKDIASPLMILFEDGRKMPLNFKITKTTKTSVTFTAKTSTGTIQKIYTLDEKNPYALHMTVQTTGFESTKEMWLSMGLLESHLTCRKRRFTKSILTTLPRNAFV